MGLKHLGLILTLGTTAAIMLIKPEEGKATKEKIGKFSLLSIISSGICYCAAYNTATKIKSIKNIENFKKQEKENKKSKEKNNIASTLEYTYIEIPKRAKIKLDGIDLECIEEKDCNRYTGYFAKSNFLHRYEITLEDGRKLEGEFTFLGSAVKNTKLNHSIISIGL